MFDKIAYLLAYNRKAGLSAALALLVVMIFLSRPPSVDSSLAGYNIDNNPYDSIAARMMSLFGSRNLIQIVVKPEPESTINLFSGLTEVEANLQKAFPGIKVESIISARRLLSQNYGVDNPVKGTLIKAQDIPVVRNLVSRDTSLLLVVAYTDHAEKLTSAKFDSIIALKYRGIDSMNAISPAHIQDEIEHSIIRDYLVILPVILIFISCFIFLSYSSFSPALFCLLNLIMSFIPVTFFLTIFRVTINQITASAVPIAAILSLSASIHLVTGYLSRFSEVDLSARIYQTFRHYLVPSFLSALTTAIAFGSFFLSDSHYIRQFGIVTACTIIIVFLLIYLTATFTLRYVKGQRDDLPGLRLTRNLERLLITNKREISIILLVIVAASVLFLPRIKFRTDLETYIPKGSEAQNTNLLIKNNFHSIAEIDILVEPDYRNDTDTIRNLKGILIKAVSELSEGINSYPEVVLVESIRDQLDYEQHNMFLGITTVKFSRYGNPFVSEDREKYRINVKLHDQKDIITVTTRLEGDFKKYEGILDYSLFSDFLFFDYISTRVTKSLLKSLLFSAFLIALILHFLSRKKWITFVSLLANAVPLGFLVIIFAVFGIDINISTSISLVICLGLIVDDTIHILHRRARLGKPMDELGYGILTTSLILTGGFLTFLLSQSGPNQIFGVLCSVTFLIAAIADMSIIPWLLNVWCNWRHV